MRTTILIGILASVQGIQAACDDACASAITGIGQIPVALMSRTYDCEMFLRKTVTPTASLVCSSNSSQLCANTNLPLTESPSSLPPPTCKTMPTTLPSLPHTTPSQATPPPVPPTLTIPPLAHALTSQPPR
jgi:hypothetical protein